MTGGDKPGPIDECTSTASDAFYVPATKAHMFLPYAERMLREKVFLELAYPAMGHLMNSTATSWQEWLFQFTLGIDTTELRKLQREGDVCGKRNLTRVDVGHTIHFKKPNAPTEWRKFVEEEL
jgi:hypothetical protein